MNFRAKEMAAAQVTQTNLFKNSAKQIGANAMTQANNYSRKSNSTGRSGMLRHANPAANIQNAVRRNQIGGGISQGGHMAEPQVVQA